MRCFPRPLPSREGQIRRRQQVSRGSGIRCDGSKHGKHPSCGSGTTAAAAAAGGGGGGVGGGIEGGEESAVVVAISAVVNRRGPRTERCRGTRSAEKSGSVEIKETKSRVY